MLWSLLMLYQSQLYVFFVVGLFKITVYVSHTEFGEDVIMCGELFVCSYLYVGFRQCIY